jgi:SAM-dependent methyltransferase
VTSPTQNVPTTNRRDYRWPQEHLAVDQDDVREEWAGRTGAYSPEYYAHHGPNETSERLRRHLDAHCDVDDAILELGCSAGRHLAHLHDHGYENLSGVEVNEAAFEVMATTYPDLYADGTFYREGIEHVVEGFADGQFAAVYAVETLQHLHPEVTWVFAELARITDALLVTVENEGDPESHPSEQTVNYVEEDLPLYYRDWNGIFTELGLTQIATWTGTRDTGRVFRVDAD